MRAMILAAGRGERMRPLTDHCPKPLLPLAGKPLLQYHIEALVAAGICDIVINHAWLGDRIEAYFGNGHALGASIVYSAETSGALETAGGIRQALPLLGDAPFVVVNGDVFTQFDFSTLPTTLTSQLAHLVLVPNPPQHPHGDFAIQHASATEPNAASLLRPTGTPSFTFSGIGVYQPMLFQHLPLGAAKLAPLLRAAMEKQRVTGEVFQGLWADIGTPQRLTDMELWLGAGAQPATQQCIVQSHTKGAAKNVG